MNIKKRNTGYFPPRKSNLTEAVKESSSTLITQNSTMEVGTAKASIVIQSKVDSQKRDSTLIERLSLIWRRMKSQKAATAATQVDSPQPPVKQPPTPSPLNQQVTFVVSFVIPISKKKSPTFFLKI